jgi:hypothetical protein
MTRYHWWRGPGWFAFIVLAVLSVYIGIDLLATNRWVLGAMCLLGVPAWVVYARTAGRRYDAQRRAQETLGSLERIVHRAQGSGGWWSCSCGDSGYVEGSGAAAARLHAQAANAVSSPKAIFKGLRHE